MMNAGPIIAPPQQGPPNQQNQAFAQALELLKNYFAAQEPQVQPSGPPMAPTGLRRLMPASRGEDMYAP